MRNGHFRLLLTTILLSVSLGAAFTADIVAIKVSEKGLQSLQYRGVEYCDSRGAGEIGFTGSGTSLRGVKKDDSFATTPTSVSVTGTTVTQTYPWGSLVVTYAVKGADLNVTATLRNNSGAGLEGWKVNVLQLNDRIVFRGGGGAFGFSPDMQWAYYYEHMGIAKDPYAHLTQQQPHVYWWVDRAAPFEALPVKVMFADLTGTWDTGVARLKTAGGDRWPVQVSANAWEMAPPGQLQTNTVQIAIRFRDKSPGDSAAMQKTQQHLQLREQAVAAAQAKLQEAKQNLKGGVEQELDIAPGEAHAAHADVKANAAAVRTAELILAARQTELEQAQSEKRAAEESLMPSALEVCADGYEAWGRYNYRDVVYTDRRPIGVYFGCRDAQRSSTNPNGWFKDPKVDTTTPEGRMAFAKRLLAEIDASIAVLKQVNAQGVLWWDLEGQRQPQPITYVGDPRVLDPAHPAHQFFAPELDTPVDYQGQQMKLVDACFNKWQDAGLKTGVTIRPQTLVWNAPDDHDPAAVEKVRQRIQAMEQQIVVAQAKLKGAQEELEQGIGGKPVVAAAEQALKTQQSELAKLRAAQQVPPSQTSDEKALADNLCAKATYARERWGCTMFYVDSISEWFGNWWLEKAVQKNPDILLMPEWARTRSYRHSSAFSYTKFTGFYRGVPAEMQACWPDAFCCMGNVDYEKNYDDALYAVQHGNIQMFNCWYLGEEARKIKQIYQATGIRHTPHAEDQAVTALPDRETPITLVATDEDGDAVTYSILGPPAHGTLTLFNTKAGTMIYTPDKGYTGPDSFTFKATDTTGLNSNRGKVTIGEAGGR